MRIGAFGSAEFDDHWCRGIEDWGPCALEMLQPAAVLAIVRVFLNYTIKFQCL